MKNLSLALAVCVSGASLAQGQLVVTSDAAFLALGLETILVAEARVGQNGDQNRQNLHLPPYQVVEQENAIFGNGVSYEFLFEVSNDIATFEIYDMGPSGANLPLIYGDEPGEIVMPFNKLAVRLSQATVSKWPELTNLTVNTLDYGDFDNHGSSAYYLIFDVGPEFSLNGALTFNYDTFGGSVPSVQFKLLYDESVTVIPEPAHIAGLAFVLGGLWLTIRRRRA